MQFQAADIFPGTSVTALDDRLAVFRDHYARLPPDPNAPEANRYRCYARGVVLPWTRRITWGPGTPDLVHGQIAEFTQGQLNPEYLDQTRIFPYAPRGLLADPTLHHLVFFDLVHTDWPAAAMNVPIHVGVHFVNLLVNQPDQVATSSPDCLHQDGGMDSVYFVHLLDRNNVTGGATVIAEPACAGLTIHDVAEHQIRARFTLDEPLDSYAIIDSQVSHYITPVRTADAQQPGHRAAILIGLIPYTLPI
jgi:hypothetical protein